MTGYNKTNPDQHDPVVRERSTYITNSNAQLLCQAFADGLESGLNYARILDLLERHGNDKQVLKRLRVALLQHGDVLGEAFERYGILDASARKLILVAEQQGGLPGTFKQLAKIYDQRHKRKKRLFYALVEPLVFFILGMVYARKFFKSNLVELAYGGDTIGAGLKIFGYASIQALMVVIAYITTVFTSLNLPVEMPSKDFAHRLLLRIPVFKNPGSLYAISLFCVYIRQSVSSGMTILKSLELAANASNSPQILNDIHLAQDQIKQGATLAQSLSYIKKLPQEVIDNIDIGEETGQLENRLEWLADRYEVLSNESFDRQLNVVLYISRIVLLIFVLYWVTSAILGQGFIPDM